LAALIFRYAENQSLGFSKKKPPAWPGPEENIALEVVTTSQMKLLFTVRSLVLAAALSASPMFTATAAALNADAVVPFWDFVDVTVGTHRRDVPERIGEPPDRFSPDVWVYWDYRDPRRATDERYQTLIIIFTGDRVTRIRFTDTKETRAALAKFRRDQAIALLPPPP
jgi:hypothetical protein